jgi:hypothetical protein
MMSLCEIARLPAPFMGIFEAANMMWEGQQSPPLAGYCTRVGSESSGFDRLVNGGVERRWE